MRLVSLVWLPKQWRFGFHRQCLAVVLPVDDKQDLFEMMFVELCMCIMLPSMEISTLHHVYCSIIRMDAKGHMKVGVAICDKSWSIVIQILQYMYFV